MRWGTRVAASTVVMAFLAVQAHAAGACSRTDGTVPGSSATVIEVPAGVTTFYVDDRDYPDLDNDGEAGGIWIYEESNGESGLQRGGSGAWWEEHMPGTCELPLGPTPVLEPDPNRPVLPNGIVLFPHGFGGGAGCWSWYESYDPCAETANPDRLWF